jgi:hypothetical protein
MYERPIKIFHLPCNVTTDGERLQNLVLLLSAYSLSAGRDLYRATPTMILGLAFAVSSEGPSYVIAS